jgi:hypothetical protein
VVAASFSESRAATLSAASFGSVFPTVTEAEQPTRSPPATRAEGSALRRVIGAIP